jgi:hypothetical protein
MITRTGSYRSLSHDDGHVLWVDIHKTVGVRFQVSPGAEDRMPLITGPDDFPPLHYKLQFEGMQDNPYSYTHRCLKLFYFADITNHPSELYIQTTKLLLAVERSEIQEVSHSGKAVVIASM